MKIPKKILSLVLSVAFGVALLVIVLLKFPLHNVISAFTHVTPKLVFAYLAVSGTIMFVLSYRWKVLLDAEGYRNISFFHLVSYKIIDYGVSYITPTAKIGGEPVRAAMLMRHGISFKEGLTTVTIDKTIELSFTLLMFILGCIFLILGVTLPGGVIVFLLVISALLLFLIWKFYSRILQGKPIFISFFRFMRLHKFAFLAKYQHAIIDFEKPIMKFYQEKKKAYFIALLLTIFAFSLSMVEFHVLLLMVGVNASLGVVFMVFSVVGMAFVIPVPMGLGSLEAMQAWLFSALGLSSAAGIGLAMITRSRDLIWVLLAVVFSLYYGSLRKVLDEAYNSKYNNPIVKMTFLRNGKPAKIKIKLHQKHHEAFVHVQSLRKRYLDFNRMMEGKFRKKEK